MTLWEGKEGDPFHSLWSLSFRKLEPKAESSFFPVATEEEIADRHLATEDVDGHRLRPLCLIFGLARRKSKQLKPIAEHESMVRDWTPFFNQAAR